MSPEERWDLYQEMPEILMVQIMENAVRLVHDMGGAVWAEGNTLKVRVEIPGRYHGRTVRLHVT